MEEKSETVKLLDQTLRNFRDKKITPRTARLGIFGSKNDVMMLCPDSSDFAGTIVATKGVRGIEVHWCLGKLVNV